MTAVPSSAVPVFRGVGVALLTLFDEHGGLLVDDTADFAAMLANQQVAAVLVGGTTGEFWTLLDDERHTLTRAVRARVPSTVPVIEQVGSVTAARTLSAAKEASTAGADAVMCMVSPDTSPQGLLPQVRDVIADLPLLAYHFPGAGFASVPVETLTALPVDGIKDSSGDAQRLRDTARLPLPAGVFTGSPLLLDIAGDVGAAGALLALANLEPAAAVAAFDGDRAAGQRLAQLHQKLATAPPPYVLKQLVAERWGTPPWTRGPVLHEAWPS